MKKENQSISLSSQSSNQDYRELNDGLEKQDNMVDADRSDSQFEKTFEDIRSHFHATVGSEIDRTYDKQNCLYWYNTYQFKADDFKYVIDRDLANERQKAFFKKNPHLLSISNLFNPQRGEMLLRLLEARKIAHRLSISTPPKIDQSAEIRCHKIRLSCCGSVFERKMVKVYRDQYSKGEWIWDNENRDIYENHTTACLIQ